MSEEVAKAALYCPGGCHRYALSRVLYDQGGPPRFDRDHYAMWVGAHPSEKDHRIDDERITREWAYTRDRLGIGAYLQMNCMDAMTDDTADLAAFIAGGGRPSSRENLGRVLGSALKAQIVILAYGHLPVLLKPYADLMTAELVGAGIRLFCLGVSHTGAPVSMFDQTDELRRFRVQ